MKSTHAIKYGKSTIHYTLHYSNRKTVAISVQPDSQVVITAPEATDLYRIQQLVLKRARWIQKQQQYFQQFLPRTPARQFVGGESHLYLGRQYRLKLILSESRSVKLSGGYLAVHHPDISLQRTIEETVYSWYRNRAEQWFRQRFEVCITNFPRKYFIKPPELHIRKMKSRWGSYAPSGRLTLNVELIKAPIECIDYVITHELCHAVHCHHGPKFYRLLKFVMPDHVKIKSKLESTLS